MSDHDLLKAYSRDGSQPAFAALVERHLNLVYSVARRVTRSPQLAEDVAQAVFTDLARQAGTLGTAVPVVAWLHVVSRRKSVDTVRRESRRQLREEIAATLSDPTSMNPPNANWPEIEPLLDEAVESLPPADRTAILLRFFENKSLREVGAALGTSDDAAQKRVARALEQLRESLMRRGVAVTAAGLATNISANALLTAPAALGGSILAAVGAASVAVPAAVLTLVQKALIGTGVAAAVALAVHHGLSQVPAHPVAATRPPPAVALAAAPATPPPRPANSPAPRAMPGSAEDFRVALLRQLSVELPTQSLPELRMLAPADWAEVAHAHELDTPADIRLALAKLRASARRKFAALLQTALRRFTDGNGGILPDDIGRLAPHLDAPADAEMLARYELTRGGKLAEADERLLREKPTSDMVISIGLNGWNMKNNSEFAPATGESETDALVRAAKVIETALGPHSPEFLTEVMPALQAMTEGMKASVDRLYAAVGGEEAFGNELKSAVRSFVAANPSTPVTDLGQLLPHLKIADKMLEAGGPVLAQVAYLVDHPGQPPANEEQMRRYLATSPDLKVALKAMKLQWDGEHVTMSYNFEWGGKKD